MELDTSSLSETKIISVGSGKGGVGKSTVTANLAFSFSKMGLKTAVLDADIYGFSIPRLMGLEGQRVLGTEDNRIIPLDVEGVSVISLGNFTSDVDKPVIWRGPRLIGVLKQFIEEVDWDNPDCLLVDLPPGTGDAPLSIMQMLPESNLLVVTTPQASASRVAGRIGFMAKEINVTILGIIENMSSFVCPQCGAEYQIFGPGETDKLAARLQAPILGKIPFIPEIRERSDGGRPVTLFGGPGEEVLNNTAQAIIGRLHE